MKVTVELFGRLRDAGLGDRVELEAEDGSTAREVLEALAARLGDGAGLLAGAALATEREVLSRESIVPAGASLAALPPVCGG